MRQTFDPMDFLSLARTLGSGNADEAQLRTAVGRAYYALFLVARDRLGVTTTQQVHGTVIQALTRRRKRLGDQMFALFRLRQIADYEMLPQNAHEQNWEHNWLRAQAIIGNIEPDIQRI